MSDRVIEILGWLGVALVLLGSAALMLMAATVGWWAS